MMTRGRISALAIGIRVVAGLVGLFLLLLGIGFLTLPEVFATAFFVEPLRAVGVGSIRGDFGALFLGMGFFCLLGTVTVHRRLLIVPIVFLALVLIGRLTSLVVDDVPMVQGGSMLIESFFLFILALAVLTPSAQGNTPQRAPVAGVLFNYKTLAGFAAIVLMVSGIFISQKEIGMALFRVMASHFSMRDVVGDLPDGLYLGLSGSGAPFPDAKRASPGAFVIAGKSLYLVDSGPGSTRKLELMNLQLGTVKAVLLTHFHSDHIGDLGELMLKRWAGGGRKDPLDVFGPHGVETVVRGFNLAYSIDSAQRVAHHGPEIVPPTGAGSMARPFDFPDGRDEVVIIDADGLKVTAFPVDHRPVEHSIGYRFDYKGRSLVISGDTLPCESLRRHAKGADLLVHEALQPTMVLALGTLAKKTGRNNAAKIMADIPDYHTSPEEAARIAQEAGVRHLLLYHILPPLPVSILNKTFLGDAKKFFKGPVTIGVDGLLLGMPVGGQKIIEKWLL